MLSFQRMISKTRKTYVLLEKKEPTDDTSKGVYSLLSSVGYFFSYVNDARSHELEVCTVLSSYRLTSETAFRSGKVPVLRAVPRMSGVALNTKRSKEHYWNGPDWEKKSSSFHVDNMLYLEIQYIFLSHN